LILNGEILHSTTDQWELVTEEPDELLTVGRISYWRAITPPLIKSP
jgi:hypothetical protein